MPAVLIWALRRGRRGERSARCGPNVCVPRSTCGGRAPGVMGFGGGPVGVVGLHASGGWGPCVGSVPLCEETGALVTCTLISGLHLGNCGVCV